MVVGGEVVSLKGIEESSGIVIQEMPMQVCICSQSWLTSLNLSRQYGIPTYE